MGGDGCSEGRKLEGHGKRRGRMRKKGLEVIVSNKKCRLCLGGQGAKKVIKILNKTLD